MNLTNAIRRFLRDPDEAACEALCDFLITYPLTSGEAHSVMHAARGMDPLESYHAAHIRDTIRDNFDFDLD